MASRQRTPVELRFHTDHEKTRREQEAAILGKAARDPAFRQALLTDPKAAIEKELGIPLPPSLQITIHAESADTMHLVLPHIMTSSDLQTLKNTADQGVVAAGNTGHTAIQFNCCC